MKATLLTLITLLLVGCDFDNLFNTTKKEINLVCKGTERFRLGDRYAEESVITVTYRISNENFSQLIKEDGSTNYKYKESKGWVILIDGKKRLHPQDFYSNLGTSKSQGFTFINITDSLIDIHESRFTPPREEDGKSEIGTDSFLKISINRLSGEWNQEQSLTLIRLGSKSPSTSKWIAKGSCEKTSMKI